MTKKALAKLTHRSDQLRKRVHNGTGLEIKASRELMRLSLVELYELGYWREHVEELEGYMLVYRMSDSGTAFSVTVSKPEPGRIVQYSP